MPGPLHPTPQFAREHWEELPGAWRFTFDDDDRGLRERWFRPDHELTGTIQVPFPPESAASGIGDTGFHPVLWYGRDLEIRPPAEHQRVLVHFGAVDYTARVYLNGEFLVEHVGGMTPITVDLTDHLSESGVQHLVLRVSDEPQDLTQPRGKQGWRTQPGGIFYERTSGIWQPVWLETVHRHHLVQGHWTPDLDAAQVACELTLAEPAGEHTWVRVQLSRAGAPMAEADVRAMPGAVSTRVVLDLPDLSSMTREALAWRPESPTLLDAELELRVDDAVTDHVSSYLGLRSAGFADGRFTLNGRPYFLRLVLEQGYWPQSHLAAPDPDALRREVELIKELGFNGARVHQKVEDPRFLYWCDRLGLLVWGEMANAFAFSQRAMRRLTTEWLEVLDRDRSHPCIVTWVPINESWGVPQIASRADQQDFASALYHLTRAVDPSRPTMSNEGWEHTRSDIWGVHDYVPDADSIVRRYGSAEELARTLTDHSPSRRRVLLDESDDRGQPVLLTEFGGFSFRPEQGRKWFGYATIDSAEDFQGRLEALVGSIVAQPDLAGFCYTQLTDTLQEDNGLLTADREPKLDVDELRRIISQPSAAVPSDVIEQYRRAATGKPLITGTGAVEVDPRQSA